MGDWITADQLLITVLQFGHFAKSKVPARALTHPELTELFYHKKFQFSRGSTAKPLIANSLEGHQRQLKHAIIQQQQQHSGMQQLLLKHFRTITDQCKFYSLPRSVLNATPVEDLGKAARVSVAKRGDDLPALLPKSNRPLAAEVPALQNQLSSNLALPAPSSSNASPSGPNRAFGQGSNEAGVAMEFDEDIILPVQSADQARLCLPKVQILPDNEEKGQCWPAAPDELLFFRVSHKSVHSLKRPLRSLDNIRPDDLALRFYDCVRVAASFDEADLVARDNTDVLASALFTDWSDDAGSGVSVQVMFSNLLEWSVKAADRIVQSCSSRGVGGYKLADENVIGDVEA